MKKGIKDKPKKEESVSKEDFDNLAKLVTSLAGTFQTALAAGAGGVVAPTKEVIKEKKEIDEASPDEQPMNPHWIKVVHEVLGEDFTAEVIYPKSGGVLFRVIVPKDKSNAPANYFEMHDRDKRTKEIGQTGTAGVKKWCDQIKKNLSRTKRGEIN